MPESETPPTSSQILVSDAELHYKSLTDYFKFLVTLTLSITLGGIGILTTVGLYFSFRDMAAMRAEVRQNLSDVKADVRQNMADARSDTKSIVDTTRDDAKASIDNARTATDAQISQIRDRSADIALSEAQKRVDQAFQNRNIESMVENAASRQVAPVIAGQLQREVDRAMVSLQEDIGCIGQLADAGSYLRAGARPGLDKLVTLQKSAPNENMRLRATSLLEAIGNDYEKFYLGERANGSGEALQMVTSNHAEELKQFSESEKRARLIKILIKEIHTSDDLWSVTINFIALRNLTGQTFRVFDISSLERWCKNHSTVCQ